MNSKHLLLIAVVMLSTIILQTGCATDDGGTIVRDTERTGEARISFPRTTDVVLDRDRDDPDPTISADTDRDRDDLDRPRTQIKNEIPSDAVQLQSWRGTELTYEAADPGFIYIFDETDNRIVYSGHLRRGERFVLDRARSRATINGLVVYTQDRDQARNYKVYFDRD